MAPAVFGALLVAYAGLCSPPSLGVWPPGKVIGTRGVLIVSNDRLCGDPLVAGRGGEAWLERDGERVPLLVPRSRAERPVRVPESVRVIAEPVEQLPGLLRT